MRKKLSSQMSMFLVLCSILMLFTGCATFQGSYTNKVADQMQGIRQGKIENVAAKLESKARGNSKNQVLHALQAGYYYMFMKDYVKSREMFDLADNEIKTYEQRAVVSASDIAANAQAVIGNDLELPYKGEGFEKVMLSTLQAMNYLMQRDLEGAGVEVRRAELRQEQEEARHQRELKKLDEQKQKGGVDEGSVNSILSNYGVLDSYASKVVNSFMNGYTYFLSGLIYEINRSDNDAYIDYGKSFNLYKNPYALEKLVTLAGKLGFKDDESKWAELHKELFRRECNADTGNGKAELVIIYFADQVPQKVQQKFSALIGKNLVNIAFPSFDSPQLARGSESMEISCNGQVIGRTETMLDLIPVVTKSLREQVPGMAVRQILRVLAKGTLSNQAEKKLGFLGKLGADLLNSVTEKADLRGWYELPANIQVLCRKMDPAQAVPIKLNTYSGYYQGTASEVTCNLNPDRKTIIFVHSLAGVPNQHVLEM